MTGKKRKETKNDCSHDFVSSHLTCEKWSPSLTTEIVVNFLDAMSYFTHYWLL